MRKVHTLSAVLVFAAYAAWAQPNPGTVPASESADARRQRELKLPQVVNALALSSGAKVADIGAGDGFYDVALSRAVGANGRVYAEDIDENGSIKRLKQRVAKDHLENVDVILGTADDPKLPEGALDGALMVIMYHEIANPPKLLEHIKTALKSGGRLVVVDMSPFKTASRPRVDQVKNHVIAPDLVAAEITSAGFEVILRDDHFIDNPDEESTRWMIVFRKPRGGQ